MSALNQARTQTAGLHIFARHHATALRLTLAGLFALILLGAAQESAPALPTTLGFVTAITILAVAVVGWEHQVVDAETAGLVTTQQP
jgi:hypothetical protein